MPTYVIGHLNPDTDAICSAIAYADLLRRTGMPEAEAACCGDVNGRAAFALEKAGVDHPRLVMDVRPTTAQICHRGVITAHRDESLLEAFDRMRAHNLRSIPVVSDDGKVLGMVSLLKLIELLIPGSKGMRDARKVSSSLERICKVLDAEFQYKWQTQVEQDFNLTVAALSVERFQQRLQTYQANEVLLVVGDRPSCQRSALEYGVRAIVITGKNRLPPELLEIAIKNKVTVILSPHDTATTTLLMKCAKRITDAMSDFMSFSDRASVKEIREKVQTSSEPLFPVVDENQKLIGVFSKSDLIAPPATRLVLVDHNEWAQAVRGAEEAEILEVLDHHRMGGGLSTREPIRFVNEPVGSTCTIVAKMFRQQGISPSPAMATTMAAGMISDTLFLTSPTTTATDREILTWLKTIIPFDLKKFGAELLAAGSVLQVSTPKNAVRSDCKEYTENGWRIAVAQVEEQGLDHFWTRQEALETALKDFRQERGLDFCCLLITDITHHNSLLQAVGTEPIMEAIDYPRITAGLYDLHDVVSRKKQLLPHLMRVLGRVAKD